MYINHYILEIGFFLTAKNKLCLETGEIAVDDLKTCMIAADKLDKKFEATENYDNMPKGCFCTLDIEGKEWKLGTVGKPEWKVFFNRHSTGSSNKMAHQICKSTGI